jgi:hypothetical protein
MKYQKRKRNTPIAALIKNYVDKKSGKVSVSRDEIKRRFDHLDWKDQKKILTAFLDSGISDRGWAYGKLLDCWDESFAPKVKELWETYHEYKCSWSVIRYFPSEYLQDHLDEFTDDRDYYFICLRLAKDKSFVIDRSKLSDIDYLALLYHTDRDISSDDAFDTLFRVVHDSCLKDTFMTRLEWVGEGKYHDVITPANFREVRLAFYYVVKLQQYDAACMFKQWDEELEEVIYNSPEFKAINRNDMEGDFEYNRRRIEVSNLYAFQALDDKFKQPSDPTVEQMRRTLEQKLKWSGKQQGYYANSTYSIPEIDLTGIRYDDDDIMLF